MNESPLIEELRRQYGENPRRVFARLANEYRKQGDLQTAIEICRTQVPLQPTYISGYIVLGQALYESGQLDEARATFEAAIALDPENLIALRQLGDVARQTGDLDAARGWYYKLLEVDPQNIDVANHLKALEKLPEAAKADHIGEPVSWSDINPERNPGSVPIPPLPRLTLGAIPENLTAELALAATPPKGAPVVPAVPPPVPPAPVAPPLHIAGLEELDQFTKPIGRAPTPASSAPAAPAEPLPDISAFAMTTPPTGSLTVAPVPAAPVAPPAAPPMPAAMTPPPRMEIAEEEEPPLYSPPPAPRAVSALPVAEPLPPAIDSLRDTMAFPTPRSSAALPTTPVPPAPAAPPPPTTPPPPSRPDPRGNVDVFGSVGDAEAVKGQAPQFQEEEYDPTVGRMLQLGASATGDMPAAFITETMAELYLQQGYYEEALRIYRQIAASRPDDASLRERIARLESGARSSVPVVASVSEDVIVAARDRAAKPNQTIRSFFGGLASAKPPARAAMAPAAPPVAAPASAVRAPTPLDSRPAAAALAAAPLIPPALAGGKAASLNGLFDEKVPPVDETAALALAGAYSEEYTTGAPTPAAGQPARAASQPLSLDTVFRDQKPSAETGAPAATVSFDEFFSPRDSGAAPSVRNPTPARGADTKPSAPPEADLALFHEWLDGLKK